MKEVRRIDEARRAELPPGFEDALEAKAREAGLLARDEVVVDRLYRPALVAERVQIALAVARRAAPSSAAEQLAPEPSLFSRISAWLSPPRLAGAVTALAVVAVATVFLPGRFDDSLESGIQYRGGDQTNEQVIRTDQVTVEASRIGKVLGSIGVEVDEQTQDGAVILLFDLSADQLEKVKAELGSGDPGAGLVEGKNSIVLLTAK